MHRKHGPTLRPGRLVAGDSDISVEPDDGKRAQVYRLFDHVTVTIQLKGSDDHARSLSFLLLGRRSAATSSSDQTTGGGGVKLEKCEVNFLNEIKMRASEQGRQSSPTEEDMADEPSPAKKSKEDHNSGVSLYRFFEEMKEMGTTAPPAFRRDAK